MLFKKRAQTVFCTLSLILASCGDMYDSAFDDMKVSARYFAYVTVGDSLYSYSISGNGSLKQIGYPITGFTFARGIAIHPSGDYVYVASDNNIACFKTSDNGSLTAIASFTSITCTFGVIVISGDGRYLYAIPLGNTGNSDYIHCFRINTDGTISNTGSTSLSANSTGIAINKAGTRLFAAAYINPSGTNTARINSYVINNNGTLTDADLTELFNGASGDVEVEPSGSYLYLSLSTTGIRRYEIHADGSLAYLDIFTSTDTFTDLTMHPAEKYLFGLTTHSASHGIFSDYKLYHISDNFSFTNSVQRHMAIDPELEYVYITDNGNYKLLVCYNLEPGAQLTFNTIAAEYTAAPYDVKICKKTVFGDR